MGWYDETVWVPDQGKQLVELLAKAFPSSPEIRGLLQDIDQLPYLPGAGLNARLQWTDLLMKLTEDGLLRLMIDRVVVVRPQLAPLVMALGDAGNGIARTGTDPYTVLLIGPGRLPMVDREELRQEFRRFLDSMFPALLVLGKDRSGKTHSRELFRHVLANRGGYDLRQIDFSSPSSGNDGAALLSLLCRRLGLDDVTDRESRTTSVRHAVDLVDDLVGVYRAPEQGQRVLVVDGLNRKNLKPDVRQVAAKLVTEVVNGNLPRTQLILAGYAGPLDPQLEYQILKDNIRPITRTHVRLYFQSLSSDLGRALSPGELDALVRRVMDDEPALEVFADRVRAEALTLETGP